jgi:hypothetical protein
VLLVDLLVASHSSFRPSAGTSVSSRALYFFLILSNALEMLVIDAHHDVAEHVDQTAVGVVGETLVAGGLRPGPTTDSSFRPRLRIVFIMPGIETAAPERTETSSGLALSPNFLPSSFSSVDILVDFIHQALRAASRRRSTGLANLGGDGETGRDRQADAGHFGQVGALAAEELFLTAVAVGLGLAKVIDHLASWLPAFFLAIVT